MEVALTFVAMIVGIVALAFQSFIACCKRAHQVRV